VAARPLQLPLTGNACEGIEDKIPDLPNKDGTIGMVLPELGQAPMCAVAAHAACTSVLEAAMAGTLVRVGVDACAVLTGAAAAGRLDMFIIGAILA
jgi:hypothetical protein